MFRVYANLGIPEELIKQVFYEHDRKGIDAIVEWTRQSEMQDRQRTLVLDLVNWGLSTTGIGAELGYQIQLLGDLDVN